MARPRPMLAGMSQKKTSFGLTLSNRALVTRGTRPKELIDMAVQAENTGAIDAVWVGDSILSKPRLECIPLLGAIAAHTSRVKLGVACMATSRNVIPCCLPYNGRVSTCYRADAHGWRRAWATRRANIRWRPKNSK